MSIQGVFSNFHKVIKVETDELRDKRDILFDKICKSLKDVGKPRPDILNQGSYIYGVGVIPVGDTEYDIDVGLDFPIANSEYDAVEVRKWVYDAVSKHTKNVEDRGPCIRVRYAAGYHVDLVIYSRYTADGSEAFHIARKDNIWTPSEPKKLKDFISDARKSFSDSRDSSGSDQLQRVTRYLKRWNDVDIPDDSPDKPFGLATLLLVIKHLPSPCLTDGSSNDLEALIKVAQAVSGTTGRIVVKKPTQEFEDVFAKLSAAAMNRLKGRFSTLLNDLILVRGVDDEKAIEILSKHFGDDFGTKLKKSENSREEVRADMQAAVPTFSNPSRPWVQKDEK